MRWVPSVLLLACGGVAFAFPAAAQTRVEEPESGSWRGEEQYGGAGGSWLEPKPGERIQSTVRIGGNLTRRRVPDVYTVKRGDTLWDITGRFVGNPWEWPRIWSYNAEITNPHWIYPDDEVRLRPSEGKERRELPGADDGDGTGLVQREARRSPEMVYLRDEGYLDRDALEAAGEIIGSPEEHMLLSPYDEVYVRFAGETRAEPGQQLTVFRRFDSETDRVRSGSGVLVRILGTVRMKSYDPERGVGRAVITEALDPIERGYNVATIARQFELVPPRENPKDMVAEVVATIRPRQMLADTQMIFIDAGGEQGIEKGNRFFVVRRGDEWRQSLEQSPRDMGAAEDTAAESEDFPPEIIAEARVVDVRPRSSALMITRSVRAVKMGDRAEMRAGY